MGAFAFATAAVGGGGSGSPGGASPQIQFNNGGTFGGAANLEFDSANATLRGLTGLTGGIRLFNTADVTTNTESLRAYWTGNLAVISSDTQGSGSQRELTVGTFNGGSGQNRIRFFTGGSVTQMSTVSVTTGNSASIHFSMIPGSLTASSGVQTVLSLNPPISQTGTAGYTGLLVNATETTVGTGVRNLILTQVGGVNRFRVSSTGDTNISSTATLGLSIFNTADEVTNTEFFRASWASNICTLESGRTGTGVTRTLRLRNADSVFVGVNTLGAGTGNIELASGSTSITNAVGVRTSFTSTAASGTPYHVEIAPTINQSGTAGYTALRVAVTETATGSGAKRLVETAVGGTVNFGVLNNGRIQYIAGNTATTVGAAGGASSLPATPTGYLLIDIGGTAFKVPYYAN